MESTRLPTTVGDEDGGYSSGADLEIEVSEVSKTSTCLSNGQCSSGWKVERLEKR